MSRWAAGISLLIAALGACSDEGGRNPDPPGVAPPVDLGDSPEPATQPPAETEGREDDWRDDDLARDRDWDDEPAPGTDPEATAARSDPAETQTADPAEDDDGEGAARDLGQELVALLSPESCLELPGAGVSAGETLEIRAEAVVLPSGRLQGASAQVRGQQAEALACLAAQLEGSRLRGPVDDAPRRVSGSLTMEVQNAP